jgi:hypothetical protein
MGQSRKLLLAPSGGDWRGITGAVVRPAVEAVLLAAVALGIGQAGVAALSSAQASASGPDGTGAADADAFATPLSVSPFAPMGAGGGTVALAELGAVRIVGVRMAADPMRSGAVVSLSGGAQQAFLTGQEILSGVRLERVEVDGVVVSYRGGMQRIAMPTASGPSSAQLLMGQAGPAAPIPAQFGAAEQAWMADSIAAVVIENGMPIGYRLAPNPPAAVREAGLSVGDVIISINGASATEPLAAIAAIGEGGSIALGVRPAAGGEVRIVRFVLPALEGAAP